MVSSLCAQIIHYSKCDCVYVHSSLLVCLKHSAKLKPSFTQLIVLGIAANNKYYKLNPISTLYLAARLRNTVVPRAKLQIKC